MQEKICIKGLEGIINTQEELEELYKKIEQSENDIKNGNVKPAEEVFAMLRKQYHYR